MDLLELLAAGRVDDFNAARGHRARLDLFACDLAGAQLPSVDLSGANVGKADLSEANLEDANLVRTDLTGIDGTDLKLGSAIGLRAKLREAWLEKAVLSEADFSRGDFADAYLVGTQGNGTRFTGARLREVDARDASWPNCDLSEAKLHKGNFTNADLRSADLTDASGAECVLDNAKLDGSVGKGVKLPQASMKGTSLVGVQWRGANLMAADLTGADLQFADLTGANLAGAILTGARVRGAVFVDAALDGVDMTGLDLEAVDLTGVDPLALGLTDEQVAAAAAVGVQVDEHAPLRFGDIDAARQGDAVCVTWINRDGEESDEPAQLDEEGNPIDTVPSSLRWAIAHGGTVSSGILPLSADAVLARTVAPDGDGFAVIALHERPGGTHLVKYPLQIDGQVGRPSIAPLGFQPAVRPVVKADADGLWMWNLARRGPTIVISRLNEGEEGLEQEVVRSQGVSTARGFLGRHHPVLACKGEVLMPVTRQGTGAPTRMASEFRSSRHSAAIPFERQTLLLWAQPAKGRREPGGLRYAWLGGRKTPEVHALTTGGTITAVDAMGTPEGIWVTWAGAPSLLAPCAVYVACLPDHPTPVKLDVDVDANEVRFTEEPAGGGQPCIAIATLEEGLVVVTVGGDEIGRTEPTA